MNNKNLVFAAASVIVISSSPAFAQSEDFDGPFVGAHAGWESKDLKDPITDAGTILLDDDQQAFTGGIVIGYDKRIAPRFVVGTEASFDLSADDATTGTTAAGLAKIDPKWSLDLTGRAGYLVDEKTLAYVRGGYTNARIETGQATALGELTQNDHRDGWLVGAGIERQLLPGVAARFEYRYSDLSEGDGTWDRHRMLTGLTYRF